MWFGLYDFCLLIEWVPQGTVRVFLFQIPKQTLTI
jgi:hypothetical protein